MTTGIKNGLEWESFNGGVRDVYSLLHDQSEIVLSWSS